MCVWRILHIHTYTTHKRTPRRRYSKRISWKRWRRGKEWMNENRTESGKVFAYTHTYSERVKSKHVQNNNNNNNWYEMRWDEMRNEVWVRKQTGKREYGRAREKERTSKTAPDHASWMYVKRWKAKAVYYLPSRCFMLVCVCIALESFAVFVVIVIVGFLCLCLCLCLSYKYVR